MAVGGSKSVILNILGNAEDALEALNAVKARASEMEDKGVIIPVEADGEEAGEQLDAVADSAGRAADAAGKLAESQDKLAGSGDAAADAAGKAAGSQDKLAAATDKAAEASARAADAQKEQGDATDAAAGKTAVAGDRQEELAAKTGESGAAAEGSKAKWGMVALGIGAVAAVSVDMATKFQEASTTLVTGAGESAKALPMVKQGMLEISSSTGTASSDIVKGMFMIESAGFHGAAGLKVLRAAAEGAKVGGADLGDMANAVTSALNAYHEPASKAVAVTDQLVATVAHGKMTMQQLASSVANVLPIAASAHISFAQVGGALATMTGQGMSARRASMNLANMIRSIISPSSTASAEMKVLGLNANHLAANVGKAGLTGTLDTMTEAILRSMKGGQALAASFAGMDPATRTLARGIIGGTVSTNDLSDAMKNMTPQQAALITNFAKTAGSATGLKTTFDGAMKTMTGGATGLNVALLLSGGHAKTFAGNVKGIQAAADHAGKSVTGWALVQKDLGTQMDEFKTTVEDLGIAFGSVLLPAFSAILKPIASFAGTLLRVHGLMVAMGIATGIILGIVGAMKLWAMVTKVVEFAQAALNTVMSLNPIGIIIIAVVALIAIFYELWKHVKAFRDFWKDAWRDIKAWAVDAWHALTHAFDNIGHAFENLGHALGNVVHAIEKVWDDLTAGAKRLWHDVVSFFTGLWHDVVSITERLWHDVVSFFTGLWHDVVSITEQLHDDEFSLFDRIRHDVVSAAERLVSDVTGFFRRLPGDIIHALGDLGSLLVHAGKDIVDGLIHGIESAAGGLLGTVSHLAGDVEGAFKSVLGILSPSRVFRRHGQDIVAGLIRGIADGSPAAVAAARRLADVTSISGHGSWTGTGAAGGGGGQQVVLRVEGGGSEAEQAIAYLIRHFVRVQGGNVQKVLGH